MSRLVILVVVVVALIAPGAVVNAGPRFTDVPEDHVFAGDIEWLAATGITRGCNPPGNDRFCPDDTVTRGQMAAFLVRAFGLTARSGDPFRDDDGSIFENDIESLAAAGITRGCNPPANDHFCPNAAVTRAQMAAFLQRALTATPAAPGIIPESRRTTWDPGIPGGIPNGAPTTSVVDHGAAGDGVTDDYGAFAAAVASLPVSGGVVHIPPGTYRLGERIALRDGVVLSGSGPAQTRLEFDLGGANTPVIEAVTYERGAWRSITDGLGRGSTVITVADVTGITAPGFAEIEQSNDAAVMYTDPAWDVDWAESSVGEMVRIIGVSGNQVTIAEPLHHDYRAALEPRLRPLGLVEYAGVENLSIERLDPGDGPTIAFKNAAYVWVSNVMSEMTYRAHVSTSSVYRCEIRDSWFNDAHDHGGGGHGYGTSLGRHTTSCLVENNVFTSLRHSMIIQLGATANVFGYNFSTDSHNNNGDLLPDISLHGHYPAMNLFEGNIVEEIGFADYWGPVGPGNTALRNCVTAEGVFIRDESHTQNIVGNALLGHPDEVVVDSTVSGTLLHGNLEAGTIHWDPDITQHAVPASLYLESAPLFYGTGTWPSTGSEFAGGCDNPARFRWASAP